MRIGVDIRLIGKNRTGDEVYFFNLVKNLAVLDHENNYFLYTDRNPSEDKNLQKEIGRLNLPDNFKIEFVSTENRFLWNLWLLPTRLQKDKIDIFHTQYISPFWLPKKVKLVLTIHDISFNFFPQYINKSDLFFLKMLIPRSIRRADKIITVSENEKRNIIDFYQIRPEKVDFIYNGVDFEKFNLKFSPEEIKKINTKYKLLNTKFILYLGTFQPRKNIPALIEALDLFYKNNPDQKNIKLVLAGNIKAHNFDRRIDELIEKYKLNDQVIFSGWVVEEDKSALLKLAEAFVFPSLYEGFGIPILEAMASGIPVLSSDKSCLKEIGDDSALFTNPLNTKEFSEKIHKILTDDNLRVDLIKRGQNNARKYSWRETAKKTLEIYKSLA